MLEKLKAKTGSLSEGSTKWLASLPTTNFRIFITMVVFFGTAVRYWTAPNWNPSWEWLSFLIIMSGLDVTQFTNKRRTSWKPETTAEIANVANTIKESENSQESEIG